MGSHGRSLALLLASVMMLAACASGSASVYAAAVSDDDSRLRLTVNTCNASHETTVTDAGDHVEVAVTATGDQIHNDCQDIVIVDLPTSLRGRDLIDRSTGEVITVSLSDHWPYDRDRFSPADYEAALAEMVACLESRDPGIEAAIVDDLNWPTYEWHKERDEQGNVSAPAIGECSREHLEPLRG